MNVLSKGDKFLPSFFPTFQEINMLPVKKVIIYFGIILLFSSCSDNINGINTNNISIVQNISRLFKAKMQMQWPACFQKIIWVTGLPFLIL
jgi:hypothetical protein